MYRYSVDNAITYTPDDVALFRESPFAVWMERLTLENPEHGIPPDFESTQPRDGIERQDDIVTTLRTEGRNVALIDWELDEAGRRAGTLAAMRSGADFVVNGQLACGTLSGSVHLLMRTSGYSQLGDFLYIPCDTQSRNTLQSAFRLSFVAELLQIIQGQLPPQMLIIRDGVDVVPLQTEDHIYYYRAVQQRFLQAMQSFRKHRMPDPAESSHFGRWSECASEVLKQRALSEQHQAEELQAEELQAEEEQEQAVEMPQLLVAGGSGASPVYFDSDLGRSGELSPADSAGASTPATGETHRGDSGITLAEQARLLAPGSYSKVTAPGHTPNLARFGHLRSVAVPDKREPGHNRRSTDATLENLQFIGSSTAEIAIETKAAPRSDSASAPSSSLRDVPKRELHPDEGSVKTVAAGLPDIEPRLPVFLPPDPSPTVAPPPERLELEPLDSDGFSNIAHSVIDLDGAPAPSLVPEAQKAEAEYSRVGPRAPQFRRTGQARPKPLRDDDSGDDVSPFSNSLITSDEFNDC